MYMNLTGNNQSLLQKIIDSYGQQCIFYRINENTWRNVPQSKKFIEAEAYNRLLVSTILPSSINRVLYLDSDIVVVGDIKELWSTSLDNQSAAVVVEPNFNYQNCIFSKMGMPEERNYFNSGVLLVNLDYFREHHLEQRVNEMLTVYRKYIVLHDQDVLNIVFRDSKKLLSDKWNYLGGRTTAEFRHEYRDRNMQPIIVHFIGPIKPWHWGCRHIYTREYLNYLKKTPWRDNIPTFGSTLRTIFHPMFYIAYLLHMEKVYSTLASIVKNNLNVVTSAK